MKSNISVSDAIKMGSPLPKVDYDNYQVQAVNRALRKRRMDNMAKYNIDINEAASDDIKKRMRTGG